MTHRLVELLSGPQSNVCAVQQILCQAAVAAIALLMEGGCVVPGMHCVVRGLYRQRFFVENLPRFASVYFLLGPCYLLLFPDVPLTRPP